MISIIIPCYNEASILGEFINILEKKISNLDEKFEIIFIDNNSSDDTVKIIETKIK